MVSYQTVSLITGSITMSAITVNLINGFRFSIMISNPLASEEKMKVIIPSIIGEYY